MQFRIINGQWVCWCLWGKGQASQRDMCFGNFLKVAIQLSNQSINQISISPIFKTWVPCGAGIAKWVSALDWLSLHRVVYHFGFHIQQSCQTAPMALTKKTHQAIYDGKYFGMAQVDSESNV